MKQFRLAIPFWIIASTAVVLFHQPVMAADTNQNTQQNKLQELTGEIKQLSSAIRMEKKTRKSILKDLADTEKKIGRLGRHIHRLQAKIATLDRELVALDKDKKIQQQMLDREKSQLRSLVMSAYATGRQERIKLFLNQQDPVLMNRIMTYYDYFNRERIERIESARALLDDIRNTEETISIKKLALDSSYAEKNAQLEQIQQAKQARAELLAKLDADIDAKTRSLSQLKEDAASLRKLLDNIQLQKIQQKREQKFSSLKGKLNWPAKGFLSKFFGSDKVGGVKWDGVFITAPEGREVRAVHHGKVAYADWLRGYGLLVIIDHGEGYMSLYGHNQTLFKEAGDWVDAGESIALVGNSGGQKNPGLYFSIRSKGKPSNPKKWCRKLKGRTIQT